MSEDRPVSGLVAGDVIILGGRLLEVAAVLAIDGNRCLLRVADHGRVRCHSMPADHEVLVLS